VNWLSATGSCGQHLPAAALGSEERDLQEFVDQLPHGQLHVVDNAGHLAWYDDPAGVGERVRVFLTS
jgi:pimeloyl-ACP methyl ester carboxylesterase